MAGVIRATARARLARLLGDHLSSTFTSVTGTTGVDTAELGNYGDNTLAGKFVYITSGTGVGQERVITANSRSSTNITVPTWGTNPTSAAYEIHGLWRVAQYNEAINAAISDMKGDGRARVTLVSDTSLTMTQNGDSGDYYLTLPSGLRSVHNGHIQVEGPTNGIYDERPLRYGQEWWFEKKTAETSGAEAAWHLVLNRNSYVPISGRQLRIVGAGVQAELADDSTALLADQFEPFVIHRAAYYLLQQKTLGGTPTSAAQMKRAENHWKESENARSRFDYVSPPGTKKVPW